MKEGNKRKVAIAITRAIVLVAAAITVVLVVVIIIIIIIYKHSVLTNWGFYGFTFYGADRISLR